MNDTKLDALLLTRNGVAVPPPASVTPALERVVRGMELELAALGYVVSTRLRAQLAQCSSADLTNFCFNALATLRAHLGADQKHEPLFRTFPDGIPSDTTTLWWKKVLVHYVQATEEPCIFCAGAGTTHVLNPCLHVVCDACFDGASYSACPVCEHAVDRSSPFFREAPERAAGVEHVRFKRVELARDRETEAKVLFTGLCARKQVLSPTDVDALVVLVESCGAQVLEWLPDAIPVRENVATIFGTLARSTSTEALVRAKPYMVSATDLLRFLAVFSGKDASLLPESRLLQIVPQEPPKRFWARIAAFLASTPRRMVPKVLGVSIKVTRFKVARLSRNLRRAMLGTLESFNPDLLIEDMLRHRSLWIWAGEFLHPHEYAKRFPNVARAFQVVRKKSPTGVTAPAFRTWSGRVEQAMASADTVSALRVLAERPGEFARRLDRVLRACVDDRARDLVVVAFQEHLNSFVTPVLLTLRNHLPTRVTRAPARLYWPKGPIAQCVSQPDTRSLLLERFVATLVRSIEHELLRRFESKPSYASALIDEALRTVPVPFNERTAARAAVSLPRGARIPVPLQKTVRLFLHWCQPERGGESTDLDLSVAFYDREWAHVGVCSYYELELAGAGGTVIAKSSGDLRDAPFPDGASEFVDLDCEQALAAGYRYAVMVINAYAGMPFRALLRGFAGVMLRDSTHGAVFDPRTAHLKFALDGENGVYVPMVVDLELARLHWLDVQSKGQFALNNVQSSNRAISTLCPQLLAYFSSGARASMYDLALLHAAARSRHVVLRAHDGRTRGYARADNETAAAFYARLSSADGGAQVSLPEREPVMAFLLNGDIDLPEQSLVYALFRERLTGTIAASDLLS
jgi:hypothetical protein